MVAMDEWTELEAPPKPVKASEPVTFATVRVGRSDVPRATFSFAESIAAEIGWPRYRIEWNRNRKAFRIRGAADGPFEGFHPPRGPNAASDGAGGASGHRPGAAARRPGDGRRPRRRGSRGGSAREDARRPRPVEVLGEAGVRVR